MKKIVLLVCAMTFALFLVSCDDGSTENPDGSITEHFDYYLVKNEDISFYSDYSKNPYVEYIETMPWNTTDEGKDVYIDFEFQAPAAGQELNQIVTMLSTGSYLDIMSIQHYKRAGSVKDLYEQGIVLELTEYVETYMPN